MTVVLAVLAVACAAFLVWMTIRVFNRRERWAKWTLATTVVCYGIAIAFCWTYLWRTQPGRRGVIRSEFALNVEQAHSRAGLLEKPLLIYFCTNASANDLRMDFVLGEPELSHRLRRFECAVAYVSNIPTAGVANPDKLEQDNIALQDSLLNDVSCPSFVVVDSTFPMRHEPMSEMILGTSIGLSNQAAFAGFLDSAVDRWISRHPQRLGTSFFIPVFAAAFAASAVWLTVRVFNRRERWAMSTFIAVILLPVIYVSSFGPACWIVSRQDVPSRTRALPDIYRPLWACAERSDYAYGIVVQFARVGMAPASYVMMPEVNGFSLAIFN